MIRACSIWGGIIQAKNTETIQAKELVLEKHIIYVHIFVRLTHIKYLTKSDILKWFGMGEENKFYLVKSSTSNRISAFF